MNQSRREHTAVFALLCLIAITAGWWALALWPAGDAPPAWLERARYVCFNAVDDGLPDASGWLLLVGQPLGMLAVLMAVWGSQVRAGLKSAAGSTAGRVGVGAVATLVAVGLVASGVRVASVTSGGEPIYSGGPVPDTYPRLDRDAPSLSLLDQHGERLTHDALLGRPALVTFAFGNCQTVCPAVVKQIVAARRQLDERAARGEMSPQAIPRLVIVSLDPWRDTVGRLGHLTEHWDLRSDDHVITGPIEEVESVLDAWNVARSRDPNTGDITHPSLVYILDAEGRLAYATRGETSTVVELLGRLDRARSANHSSDGEQGQG